MDWLRNAPFLGINRQQPRSLLGTDEECDPSACYDSFKEHWQQALKIIQRNQQLPSHDDVLGVVNHLEQMVTLLSYDVKKIDQITSPISNTLCLEYLLSENILDKLYEWAVRTGKYINAVRLEQVKFYETLLSQSRHLLLLHDAFIKPLIKLLMSCRGEVFPRDVEKRLVTLLYQLCVLLMQNMDLLDLFFYKDHECEKFIIFALLIPFLHREDSTGMQARDALLLCMSLSKKNKNVVTYISEHSNICVLLASGLSGLYSVLPHVLTDISSLDWHRLTPDDVNDIKDLSTFVTSLEFSNAVAQVAHPAIQKQLQEFLYRGFLIPVLGPALLQVTVGECVTATTYLELILRTVTHPGLLYSLLQFLLEVQYDGHRLLNILIVRINAKPQLSLVSLSLFETIIDMNSEDMMTELVFQYLQPCLHLMLSQRKALLPIDPHCHSFEKLLALAPNVCESPVTSPRLDSRNIHWNYYGGQQSLYRNYHAYLCDARNKIAACQSACSRWRNSYNGCELGLRETNTAEENSNSLPSLGDSSGYESLKLKVDDSNEDPGTSSPVWLISQSNVNGTNKSNTINGQLREETENLSTTATAGPFLSILLEKLRHLLSNSLYVNLHLTGLISRLAVYPQPLLRTYLLDHSLVLQPNVPSLHQTIGALKQQIDEYLQQLPESADLIRCAKDFLLERETRLVNARRNAIDRNLITSVGAADNLEPFQRNGAKRRSLTSSLSTFSTIFGRRSSQVVSEIQLNAPLDDLEHKSVHPIFSEAQNVALCAVLLEEWVKELAALAQEHTIAQLAPLSK